MSPIDDTPAWLALAKSTCFMDIVFLVVIYSLRAPGFRSILVSFL